MYRFGITMRITNAVGYDEPRESVATDWLNYLIKAFKKPDFVFIPNIEHLVADYIDNLNINALILTGGDDLGVFKRRDNTERIALKHALSKKIPIIAVCRGLQLVHTFYGGKTKKGNVSFEKTHKATKHKIDCNLGMVFVSGKLDASIILSIPNAVIYGKKHNKPACVVLKISVSILSNSVLGASMYVDFCI